MQCTGPTELSNQRDSNGYKVGSGTKSTTPSGRSMTNSSWASAMKRRYTPRWTMTGCLEPTWPRPQRWPNGNDARSFPYRGTSTHDTIVSPPGRVLARHGVYARRSLRTDALTSRAAKPVRTRPHVRSPASWAELGSRRWRCDRQDPAMVMPPAMIPAMGGIRALGVVAVMLAGLAGRRRRRADRPKEPDRPADVPAGAQLARTRPSQHELDGTDLREANIRRARIVGRDLTGRDLQGAQLNSARLDRTVLADGCLDRCDLSWASLRGCDLRRTSLSGTQLLEADLREALLHGADLSTASGLETVHWRSARADRTTRWPASFDAAAAGVVIERR